MLADWGDAELKLTDRVSVLVGETNGQYPSGNSLLVSGTSEAIVIDPSIDVVERGGVPLAIDAVLNSHSHEDHVAGNGLFASARVHVHEADLPGLQSLDGLMGIYGISDAEAAARFRRTVVELFHFSPRPDAQGFSHGDVFDLGGTRVEAVHLPGHTRGHSGFRISGDVFFLSDIDLTGFGPYYGDAWSDLDDFEESLRRVRDEEAAWYVTFHHKGVIEGRTRFLELLDGFGAVIGSRHAAMLEFLAEPRRLSEMVEHRFIYRPHVQNDIVNPVEERSAQLHLERMLARGEASEVEPGRYQRCSSFEREVSAMPSDTGADPGRATRNPAVDKLISRLRLEPHPEGGWYRETWRSPVEWPQAALPEGYPGKRAAMTSIYYLLPTGARSEVHRVRSEELWMHHQGDDLVLGIGATRRQAEDPVRAALLGQGERAALQRIVPPGYWQRAEARPGPFGYALVGCVVAPGFEFEDFELGR